MIGGRSPDPMKMGAWGGCTGDPRLFSEEPSAPLGELRSLQTKKLSRQNKPDTPDETKQTRAHRP